MISVEVAMVEVLKSLVAVASVEAWKTLLEAESAEV